MYKKVFSPLIKQHRALYFTSKTENLVHSHYVGRPTRFENVSENLINFRVL